MFRIRYFDKRISIEYFHALTDGNSGVTFFREIIYTYLEMCYKNDLNQENRQVRKIEYDIEDSYIKNYDIKNIYIHPITDGRDTSVTRGINFLKEISEKIADVRRRMENTILEEAMYEVSFANTINELKKGKIL